MTYVMTRRCLRRVWRRIYAVMTCVMLCAVRSGARDRCTADMLHKHPNPSVHTRAPAHHGTPYAEPHTHVRAHAVRTRGVCAKPRRHAGAVRPCAHCTRPVHRRHAAQAPQPVSPYPRTCAPRNPIRRAPYARARPRSSHTRRVRKAAPLCWCRPALCALHETGAPQTCCTSTRVAARALCEQV